MVKIVPGSPITIRLNRQNSRAALRILIPFQQVLRFQSFECLAIARSFGQSGLICAHADAIGRVRQSQSNLDRISRPAQHQSQRWKTETIALTEVHHGSLALLSLLPAFDQ